MRPRSVLTFFFTIEPMTMLRPVGSGLPCAASLQMPSMKVTRGLEPEDAPMVDESISHASGKSFWIAAARTLKSQVVRTEASLLTNFSCATAGAPGTIKPKTASARMTSPPLDRISERRRDVEADAERALLLEAERYYSGLTLASSMILRHFGSSALMRSLSSCGVPASDSK